MKQVYIILINYNNYKDTIQCVASLRKINYNSYTIVIVDNSSMDDSAAHLKSELKDCILIESKKNLGFAGGNNIGMKYALKKGADFILLLNNDTLVEKNFLSNMVAAFSKGKDIGIVGCKIMYYPQTNKIWFGGGKIDWFKFIGIHFGMRENDTGQVDLEKEIDFMTGCCMLIKREVVEKVGGLPEEYFMYFEDVDYCVKVKEGGYKIWYNPKAVIYHKIGLSSGGEESPFAIKWCTRNRLIFMSKYKFKVNKIKANLSKKFFYMSRVIKYLQYSLKGESEKSKSILAGIKMFKEQ